MHSIHPMSLTLSTDDFGHLVAHVQSEEQEAVLRAAVPVTAADDLRRALAEVEAVGYGECVWQTSLGDFRWVLRKIGDALTVVGLESRGTVTGWQHLIHATTEFEAFATSVRHELARLDARG